MQSESIGPGIHAQHARGFVVVKSRGKGVFVAQLALYSRNRRPQTCAMLWLLYALGAAVIWGINYAVSGRLLEKGMSPQTLFLVDLIFGALAVGGVITGTGRWSATILEIRDGRDQWVWLFVAVAATTAAGLLIFMSIQAKNATVASLIEVTYPLFTAFFAWALFRQTTLNAATIAGGLLIFAGVLIVARGNH
jgi:drug/metabolite transporter (DMT)-like permease